MHNLPRIWLSARMWSPIQVVAVCYACVGNQHRAYCDVCCAQSFFGARWKCVECYDYDLCDECYHADMHDVKHQFKRLDLVTSEGSVTFSPFYCTENKLRYTQKSTNRIATKFGSIVPQVNEELSLTHRFTQDMTSYFQDDGHELISRKAFSPLSVTPFARCMRYTVHIIQGRSSRSGRSGSCRTNVAAHT